MVFGGGRELDREISVITAGLEKESKWLRERLREAQGLLTDYARLLTEARAEIKRLAPPPPAPAKSSPFIVFPDPDEDLKKSAREFLADYFAKGRQSAETTEKAYIAALVLGVE